MPPRSRAECWPPPQDVRLWGGLPSADLLGSRTDAADLVGGTTASDRDLGRLFHDPAPSPAVLSTSEW